MTYKANRKKERGFTLIEVLLSVTIIALVSIAGFTSFFVLSGANRASRDRLFAVNLAQAALEEVRNAARADFNNLERLEFNVNTTIPGFTRSITISAQNPLFKRADISIFWQERNQQSQYNLTEFISRPPEPFPANVHGRVTNANTGVPVNAATLTITSLSSFYTTFTNANGDYSFIDPDGNFVLNPGNWNLRVTCVGACSGYYDYPDNIPVNNLSSGEDREVNVQLEPKPANGHILGRFIASDTNNFLSLNVFLYEGGVQRNGFLNNANGFDFMIPFNDTNPRCFTINTRNAYRIRYCGFFCDNLGWAKQYNYDGWSSSVIRETGSPVCNNPWNGNASIDRICVSPGETVPLGDISLVPVPTTTLQGYVRDSNGAAVGNARVDIRWHDNVFWARSDPTNPGGSYSISVPQEQELFPNNRLSYYLKGRAFGYLPITYCCNNIGNVAVWSIADQPDEPDNWDKIGPISGGSSPSQDFRLTLPSNQTCGNADGYVFDGKTAAGLSGVNVTIYNSRSTDIRGYYLFNCPGDAYYSTPVGSYRVIATRSGYYDFNSTGNSVYSWRGFIIILPNQKTTYQPIRLWPQGFGTIRGRVIIAGTGIPIEGATVKIDYYSDGGFDRSVQTDSHGRFILNNVIESWPAPEVIRDGFYNQAERRHTLNASFTSQYSSATITGITLDANQDRDLGDITLTIVGGL